MCDIVSKAQPAEKRACSHANALRRLLGGNPTECPCLVRLEDVGVLAHHHQQNAIPRQWQWHLALRKAAPVWWSSALACQRAEDKTQAICLFLTSLALSKVHGKNLGPRLLLWAHDFVQRPQLVYKTKLFELREQTSELP